MSAPVTGTIWKFTLYFNGGSWGWTEAYYVAATSLDSFGFPQALNTFVQARLALLYTGFNLVGIRWTILSQTGVVQSTQIIAATAYGIGPGLYTDVQGSAKIGDGPLVNNTDDTGKYKRLLIVRGVSFSCAPWSKDALLPTYPPMFLSRLNAFTGGLQNSNPNAPGYLGFNFLIQGRAHSGGAYQQAPILSGTLAPDGCHIALTVSASMAAFVGSRIHVHGVRGTNYKGIAGDGFLLSETTNAGSPVTYTDIVTNHPCCCGAVTLQSKGYIYPILEGYYQIAHSTTERTVHRNTGRPFFGTRGRRRRCNC